MGFMWVHADSFLRCVASPFHSFVATHVPTARSSADLTKPTHTPTRHTRPKDKILLQMVMRRVYGALLVAMLVVW